MFSFGFGQLAEAIKNSGFNVFLLFYYNQVLGVSATLTSVALAIALMFDAVSDPLVGSFSDKLMYSLMDQRARIWKALLLLMMSCLRFNDLEGRYLLDYHDSA